MADPSGHDAVCFHAQQSAEKYLKALLQKHVFPFPRTHDLPKLLNLLDPPVAGLAQIRSRLVELSEWAVSVRYPGFNAEAQHAENGLATAAQVRQICRKKLGLEKED